jgi:hypothetical protein
LFWLLDGLSKPSGQAGKDRLESLCYYWNRVVKYYCSPNHASEMGVRMAFMLNKYIARIRTPHGKVVGAAFLVAPDLLLRCNPPSTSTAGGCTKPCIFPCPKKKARVHHRLAKTCQVSQQVRQDNMPARANEDLTGLNGGPTTRKIRSKM